MKKITLYIDDGYAEILTISAVGRNENGINAATAALNVRENENHTMYKTESGRIVWIAAEPPREVFAEEKMNKMKEVAALYGCELGEKFRVRNIKRDFMYENLRFSFFEGGLRCDNGREDPMTLRAILTGKYEIVK